MFHVKTCFFSKLSQKPKPNRDQGKKLIYIKLTSNRVLLFVGARIMDPVADRSPMADELWVVSQACSLKGNPFT